MVVEAHIRQKFLCDFVKMFSIDELLKNETTDEEQNAKYLEVVELLLAAGYFRARIKGLTPFDKVVGGMTWCISTCDVDIDVDLLFQENSTIGQKIALTEKIVAVLPRMKCPHRIEPHQIQGLDFINIYPVVQWLVRQAIETRTEQGDRLRAYSISQFNKTHTLPQDKEKESKLDACIDAVKTFKETYKPRRVYKKPAAYATADEGVQVQSTLLEYGQKYMFTSKTGKDDNELNAEQKAVAEGLTKIAEAAEEANQEEEKKIKTLMEGMSETERQQMLSSRLVGSIVGLKSDEISNIAQHYAKRQEALEQQASELKYGKGGAVAIHQRQVAALTNAIQTEKEKLEESQTELGKISQEVNESSAKVNKLLLLKKRIEQEIENLNKQESEDTEKKLNKLRALVTQNEDLKKEEQEFKEKCLAEKKELDDKIQVLNDEIAANNNIDAERIQAIEEQIENDNKRLHKIRLLLGKKNRDNASLQWKIDAVPSRAELAQYQRRFVELYNQVASTHKETKQFYSFYNTLDDKKLQLDKEVGILNSIHDGFAQACSQSMESKNEFLDQLEKITLGVKQNEERAEKKRQSEKEKRDTLNQKSIELNEKQRLYHKTVRDFQEECKKSELIQAKIRSMEAAK